MSIKITKECINCGACEPECPNNAIYEGNKKWKMSDGTSFLKRKEKESGSNLIVDHEHEPKEKDIYFIVSEKCTECVGFYDQPQCVLICPVGCCIPDKEHIETKQQLINKKNFLHHF
ncbi:4Fe-4S dicluster domain-containing protein [Blattabacterium cuenoti]|uniref:4Fe-4S dicluster domain-containing protein n=1 Tax=Blattabacterium cuenoti TaxID=1653831 RepID=UPI00163C2FC6|nr:4Fe-4S dicluster domain-containing protein [Blattabacterium cuenoti]